MTAPPLQTSASLLQRGSLLLASAAAFACAPPPPPPDSATEKAAVEEVVRSSIAWALTKDKALLDSCFSHDGDLLILSPSEFEPSLGFDPLERSWREFWGREEYRAISFDMRDLRIDLSQSGDVAWYYAVMDDIGEWKGEPASWINTRWTGVLEKRDGRWVIVQQHFSWVPQAGE
jgi:ketosteroid isomerase-like protein